MLKWTSSILAIAIVASGCSVTADGIGPAHHAPDANKVAQDKAQLQENASSAAVNKSASGDTGTDTVQPGVLVIGTTGPLRAIENKNRDGFYAA
jgi:PBP1b-binding outer membrane lipoprotein LpoB